MQYVDAGFISRTHGLKGELKLRVSSPFSFRQLLNKKHLMLEVKGKSVPFAVEHYNETVGDEVIVKLLDCSTPEQAKAMVGCRVKAPESKRQARPKGNQQYKEFLLIDINYGEVGLIVEVIEQSGHDLFRVGHKAGDVLVPAVNDFIVEIKPRKKELYMDLPEGLLTLNRP